MCKTSMVVGRTRSNFACVDGERKGKKRKMRGQGSCLVMAYRKDLDARELPLWFWGESWWEAAERQPEAARSWWSCNRAEETMWNIGRKGNTNPRPGCCLRLTLVVYIFLHPSLSRVFSSIVWGRSGGVLCAACLNSHFTKPFIL